MKKLLTLCLAGILTFQPLVAFSNNVALPDIGTAAVSTLSIGQEIEMGDFYTRMLRGSAPIMQDPVLNEYINQLGKKLVNHADSVQTPFHFFIMKSNVLNAFAYFGGNVVVHSRLILDTDTESQLASVMAHEIGHVTQRHLARAMEDRNRNTPYVWGAALGSLLLALASPEAGMAAMSGTVAGSAQSMISFTQSNEQEADRTGLRILKNAGFSPHASADFLQKLADETRFMSKPPEILLTHPLPENRLADVRNRAYQYKQKEVPSSLDYYLAKARIVALYGKNSNATNLLLENYKKTNNNETKIATEYTLALIEHNAKNNYAARNKLQPLLNKYPNNVWFIDLMTDIDLALNNKTAAIKRLEKAIQTTPRPALQLNLANAYIENKEYQKAASMLHKYTYSNSDDINGWSLLVQAYNGLRSRAQEMSARAEILALQGQIQQAITLLQNAKPQAKNNQIVVARIDARIVQLQQLLSRYSAYQR